MGLTDRLSVEMYEDIWYKHFSTSLYSRFLFSTARNYRAVEANPTYSNFGHPRGTIQHRRWRQLN
jgi:hypothetical protein